MVQNLRIALVRMFEAFHLTLTCQEETSKWKTQKKNGYLQEKAEQ